MCEKCKVDHITPEGMKEAKEELNYSFGLLEQELPYCKGYIKAVYYGTFPVTCRFNREFNEWIKRAKMFPYNVRRLENINPLAIRFERQVKEMGINRKGYAIMESAIGFTYHSFICKVCGEAKIGFKNQVYCKGKECQKERRRLSNSKSSTRRKGARIENLGSEPQST